MKQLNANGAPQKEGTAPLADGGQSAVAKLPTATSVTIEPAQKRDGLAVVQLIAATVPATVASDSLEGLIQSAESLYYEFHAADPIDSNLAKVMCGISNMAMDSMSRALRSNSLEHRDLELKSATRAALALAELTKAYDGRRARNKPTVNVGQVNVEAGGQAVVGNVTSEPNKVPQKQEMLPLQPKIEDPTPPQK
jgi:hypothetical protein